MNDALANVLTQAPTPCHDHLVATGRVLTVLGWGVLPALSCLLSGGIRRERAPDLMLVLTALKLVWTGTSGRENDGRD